jgi:hypothetical protein
MSSAEGWALVSLALLAGIGLGAAAAMHLSISRIMSHVGWMRELIDELTVETDRARAAREELEAEHRL